VPPVYRDDHRGRAFAANGPHGCLTTPRRAIYCGQSLLVRASGAACWSCSCFSAVKVVRMGAPAVHTLADQCDSASKRMGGVTWALI